MAEINWSTDELRGLSTALGNHIAQTRKNAQDPDPRLAEQWNDELNSALYLEVKLERALQASIEADCDGIEETLLEGYAQDWAAE